MTPLMALLLGSTIGSTESLKLPGLSHPELAGIRTILGSNHRCSPWFSGTN